MDCAVLDLEQGGSSRPLTRGSAVRSPSSPFHYELVWMGEWHNYIVKHNINTEHFYHLHARAVVKREQPNGSIKVCWGRVDSPLSFKRWGECENQTGTQRQPRERKHSLPPKKRNNKSSRLCRQRDTNINISFWSKSRPGLDVLGSGINTLRLKLCRGVMETKANCSNILKTSCLWKWGGNPHAGLSLAVGQPAPVEHSPPKKQQSHPGHCLPLSCRIRQH